ncbi:hypothetical protein CpipJ_CPIJ002881 [Culex quinquefasciatus]|uniref:Uncharacterized protein n=1 Tax=Culex quinquefasciatus TaxID=7176 RepID=B0W6S8_CULQU|nr:hypothetical protein CpipJ_CPIJ002881 [Culex quinquefasciatus]|eukprot:XP_001844412.1 hypothetical protein CpipJ_CPIJ002881 [Culex quinquefasciatus]
MFLSSKLLARFVAAKTSIVTRLCPYGQRKGSVSRTRKEANFGDRGAFRRFTHLDAIELQMPYQEAFDEIKENTRLVLENRWSRHSLIRWNRPRFRINKKIPRGPPSPQKAVVANNPNLTRRTILRAGTTGRRDNSTTTKKQISIFDKQS